MKKIIVAIDGYSSCGKSTIAKQLAQYAGYTYVDTGAMYRAVALYLQQNHTPLGSVLGGVPPSQLPLSDIHITFILTPNGQHVCLNGIDVEKDIRTLEIGNLASQISTIPEIRHFLVAQQQTMGNQKGIVMDGRDIGTVVFPNAELKLFLTASPEVRAKRRFLELQQKGQSPIFEDVLRDVNDRDYRDTHRTESPLCQAPDAILIDNSSLTPDQQIAMIINIFNQKIN